MDPVSLVASWHELISRAFSDHTLAAAVITIAAIGIFVVLQQELRPYRLSSNAAYAALGWLVSISILVYVMAALRRGWALLGEALPVAARVSAYLYDICERHPILALVIVGAGTTAYFLERLWPRPVLWGPVRAACAVLVIALAIHVTGPIADLIAAEPPKPAVQLTAVPPADAVARAIKAGDTRYLSVPQCLDQVVGEVPSPWAAGVKGLGPNCRDTLGDEAALRMHLRQTYAAAYNRLMYKHNNAAVAASLRAE
ncbi:MAG TPA: hypothetical protein VG591_11785 [Burkholderiales bacterium]|jgi:hypothetical protein|nr:hypothetical protein [Burkholderiales bacterium]